MSIRWPFVLADLTGSGFVPVDGDPIRDKHFNRLFSELVALQGGIGKNPQGTAASLKARLAGAMNDVGTFHSEVLCEDDPSGQERGCRRYVDTQWFTHATGSNQASGSLARFGYTLFREPPVLLSQVHTSNAAGFIDGVANHFILAISEVAANLQFRTVAGGAPPASTTVRAAWMAFSASLEIFAEDEAWTAPPIRGGS